MAQSQKDKTASWRERERKAGGKTFGVLMPAEVRAALHRLATKRNKSNNKTVLDLILEADEAANGPLTPRKVQKIINELDGQRG